MAVRSFGGKGKQRGFFVAPLLAVVFLAGIILVAFSNRSSTPKVSSNEDRVIALNIVRVAGDLVDAINLFAQDYDFATMTLDNAAATGLYDPVKAITEKVTIAGKAATDGNAVDFVLNRATAVTGVGTSANDDVLTLSGLRDALCQRINNQVSNAALTDAIPTAMSGNEGCALIAGANVYYKVAKAN